MFVFIFNSLPELDHTRYGLNESDTVQYDGIININKSEGTVEGALEFLKSIYCSTVGAEFLHLEVKL